MAPRARGVEVLAVIPARGGSKSVPRKNVSPLAGKPLIAHSIGHAQQSRVVTRTVVTTDDDEIRDVSLKFGAEVPVMRPVELGLDDTPDLPVFEHLLNWLRDNEGYVPELVVHLRPTSPLRRAEHIDAGVKLLLERHDADSVRSVSPPSQNPFKMWMIGSDGFLQPLVAAPIPEAYNAPRQLLPSVLWHNGYVDVVRTTTIIRQRSMSGRHILPLIIDDTHAIDIDTPDEFVIAAERLSRGA